MNVLLISHCNFEGNSALHAYRIASALHARGLGPAICVPDRPDTVADLGQPPFPVLSFDDALRFGVRHENGRGPDLIHAFTPRENVRALTQTLRDRYRCPYVVHLEDHEEVIAADVLGGQDFAALGKLPRPVIDRLVGDSLMHPLRGHDLLQEASGVSALVDRLMAFKPADVPGQVFWPGFDPAYLAIDEDRLAARTRLGLPQKACLVAYTGNVHRSNLGEVRSLLLAIGLLGRSGREVRLIRSGRNHVDMGWARQAGLLDKVIDFGFLPRARMPDLLAAADLLVQPGAVNPFNELRFPSKLPEFLASGRPTILPACNLGHHLVDGEHALLLRHGNADDIAAKVTHLLDAPEQAARIGRQGRDFARKHLDWHLNTGRLLGLYAQALATASRDLKATSPQRRVDPSAIETRAPFHPRLWPIVRVPLWPIDLPAEGVAGRFASWPDHGIKGVCILLDDPMLSDRQAQSIDVVAARIGPRLMFCLGLHCAPASIGDGVSPALRRLREHPRHLRIGNVAPCFIDTPSVTVHGSSRYAEDLFGRSDLPVSLRSAYPVGTASTEPAPGEDSVRTATGIALARAPTQPAIVIIDGAPRRPGPSLDLSASDTSGLTALPAVSSNADGLWLSSIAQELVHGLIAHHQAGGTGVSAAEAAAELGIVHRVR